MRERADSRYPEIRSATGLSAIKSVGRPVIEAIIEERKERGVFTTLNDFITRMSGKDVNKRSIENFIKAGALDCLEGTRKQLLMVYSSVLNSVNQEKKNSMAGQMTLFDLAPEEDKADFELKLPDVGEYPKEELLAFEKEVLGVYISGHPLEAYEEKWRKNISAVTSDFMLDEETGATKIHDGEKVVIGGMVTAKTIKYTKTNQVMAFFTIEDLVGTVEVIIFPRDYEKYHTYLEEDAKIFVTGRANVEEEKNGKVICEKIIGFDDSKKELWLQFADLASYQEKEAKLSGMLAGSDGRDEVIIYLAAENG